MSLCTYYRAGRCINAHKCQYKLLTKDGKTLCQKEGLIGTVEKSSAPLRS